MMDIKLYIKQGCPWCVGVQELFKEHNIEHELIEVRSNPEKFEEMKKLSGQDKAPVVVIDGKVIADTDKDEVAKELGL